MTGGCHPPYRVPDSPPDELTAVGESPDGHVQRASDTMNPLSTTMPSGRCSFLPRDSAKRTAVARPLSDSAPMTSRCTLARIPMAVATPILHPSAMNSVNFVALLVGPPPYARDVTHNPDIARRAEPAPPIARLRGVTQRSACRSYSVSPGPPRIRKKDNSNEVGDVRKTRLRWSCSCRCATPSVRHHLQAPVRQAWAQGRRGPWA